MIYILEHSHRKTARCSTAYRCSTFQPAVLQHLAMVNYVRTQIQNDSGTPFVHKYCFLIRNSNIQAHGNLLHKFHCFLLPAVPTHRISSAEASRRWENSYWQAVFASASIPAWCGRLSPIQPSAFSSLISCSSS